MVQTAVADPECAKGGGLSHILAEKKRVLASLYYKKMHENSIFPPITGGRTPGMPYAGSATGQTPVLGVVGRQFEMHVISVSSLGTTYTLLGVANLIINLCNEVGRERFFLPATFY